MQDLDQRQDREKMEAILMAESVGYLGLCRGGDPYVVPVNYAYVDGTILFHCGATGKKTDYISENPRVCFSVGRQLGDVRDHGGAGACHVDNDSVLCYGAARILDDLEERARALNLFNRRYHPEAEDLTFDRIPNCTVVEIRVAEMTGRQERERKHTHWDHVFATETQVVPR